MGMRSITSCTITLFIFKESTITAHRPLVLFHLFCQKRLVLHVVQSVGVFDEVDKDDLGQVLSTFKMEGINMYITLSLNFYLSHILSQYYVLYFWCFFFFSTHMGTSGTAPTTGLSSDHAVTHTASYRDTETGRRGSAVASAIWPSTVPSLTMRMPREHRLLLSSNVTY